MKQSRFSSNQIAERENAYEQGYTLDAQIIAIFEPLKSPYLWLHVALSVEVLLKPYGNAYQPFMSHPRSIHSSYTASMLTLT